MELKCAVVCMLVSLLSVKATPHEYGVKGGAVARAEAGAAAGAFSGVGLPLSIPSGPGFSGSFSKSSSSSFASSSASSSSSSFSFSGSGATGFGLNSLGTPGSGGCAGGCHYDENGSNRIKDLNGSGSAGNGLQSYSGAKAQAAAGAYAGSLGDLKNGQTSPCVGPNCKDSSESCKSGLCGSKPSPESTTNRDHEGCALGQCGVNSESSPHVDSTNCKDGNCNGNTKNTPNVSTNEKDCASGQCSSGLPSSSTAGPSNVKCTSGKCTENDNDLNDIPVSVSSIATSSHNTGHDLSNSAKASTTTSQNGGVDCKYGTCDSPSVKPYGNSGSNTYNPHQPQSPGVGPSYNKPATHLTAPKQEAACTLPNCNAPRPEETYFTNMNIPGKTNCVGGNCDNDGSHKYPSTNYGYSKPQNTNFQSGSPASQCNSPNCYPGKVESKPEQPNYGQPSGLKDNVYPMHPHIPQYTQGQTPSTPGNCASGNCGGPPSFQPNYDVNGPKTPFQSQGSVNTPNCVSGNCKTSPVTPVGTAGTLKPTIIHPPSLCTSGPCDDTNYHTDFSYPRLPSYPQNIQPNRPHNCAYGNCSNYPSHTSDVSPVGSKFPISSGPTLATGAPGCISGNCGITRPSFQQGSFTSPGPQTPSYPISNPSASPQLSPDQTGSKFPIHHGQNSASGSPSCTSGNCGSNPAYQHGTLSSPEFQSPSYSGASPAPTPQRNPGQTGSKFPITHGKPSSSGLPGCTTGNCGGNPVYQHGSLGFSGFQAPSYSGANPAINCASGNCPNYPAPQSSVGPTEPKIPNPYGETSVSDSSGCTSGNCGSKPAYQNENFYHSSFPSPSYSGAHPAIDCASGNCPKNPTPQASAGPTGSKFPIPAGKPSVSDSPKCTSGSCGSNPAYQYGSLGSSGFQSPSYSGANPVSNCASGNCGTYPTQSAVAASGSKIPSLISGQVPFGSPVSSGSGSCASGNCPSYPSTSSTSPLASNPDKFPDYVALGVAGGAKPTSTGLFVPSSIPATQPDFGSLTSSSSAVTGGAQSSILNSFNHDKDQVYTSGFGGPPGILKPYEFKAPTPNLPSSNNNKEHHCSTGKCDGSNNKHGAHAHGSVPCTSGNCGSESGKPNNAQNSAVSGAFAGATAIAGSDGAVYTGGFGGPPGLLKPYDDGKIRHSAAISGAKHIGDQDSHSSGNKINSGYGSQSGAGAIASAGAFGSGSYNGGHNKAGGCDSGCGTSGQGSFGGDIEIAGGKSKADFLEKLHGGSQSFSSAISKAGANSFAMGGSFASSSASAHAVAGSATKGGYGR